MLTSDSQRFRGPTSFIVRPGRKSKSKDSQGKIKNKLFSLLATISQTTSRHFENVVTGALHTVFVRFASFSLQFLCGLDRKGNKWRCRDCLPPLQTTRVLRGSDWAIMRCTEEQHNTHGFSLSSKALADVFPQNIWRLSTATTSQKTKVSWNYYIYIWSLILMKPFGKGLTVGVTQLWAAAAANKHVTQEVKGQENKTK